MTENDTVLTSPMVLDSIGGNKKRLVFRNVQWRFNDSVQQQLEQLHCSEPIIRGNI